MPLSTNLASLPFELIEAIINEIDDPKCLLQLACAASLFHHLIIPHHIEYRHIRCSAARTPLWDYLFENSSLSGRIRWLEIIKEDPDNQEHSLRVPSCPEVVRNFPITVDEADYSSTAAFIHDPLSINFLVALRSFINLRRFVYREKVLRPEQRDAVAGALQSHSSLAEVQLSILHLMEDNNYKNDIVTGFGKINLFGALPLTGLSLNICITSSIDPMDRIHYFITSILPSAFPCLKQLRFRVQDVRYSATQPSLNTTHLLKEASWPLLIDLTLHLEPAYSNDLSNSGRLKIFEDFIHRHPNIERLSLGSEIIDRLDAWNCLQSLSKLRSLSLSRNSCLGKLTPIISSYLHSFHGGITSCACLAVLSNMISLHTCDVSLSKQELLCQFLQIIPSLPAMRRLSIRSYIPEGLSEALGNGYFTRLINLTHFSIYTTNEGSVLSLLVEQLSHLPNLVYLDAGSQNHKTVLQITRDPQGYHTTVPLPKNHPELADWNISFIGW